MQPKCIPKDPEECKSNEVTRGVCADCENVCAGAVGDSCGGPWKWKGICASNLKCEEDPNLDYFEGGKCVEIDAEFCKETRREMQRLKEEEARAKREREKQRERESKAKKEILQAYRIYTDAKKRGNQERESKAKRETLKAYRIYTDAKKRGNQLNEKAEKLYEQQKSLEYSLIGCKNGSTDALFTVVKMERSRWKGFNMWPQMKTKCKVNKGKQLWGIGVAKLPWGGRVGKVDGPSECNKQCKLNSECDAWHIKACPSCSRDRCFLYQKKFLRKKFSWFHLWGEKQDC